MPVVARRFNDFTAERQIYSAVNKYHNVYHKNILRCRGHSLRPNTLFFPYIEGIKIKDAVVRDIGHFIDILNTNMDFNWANRIKYCVEMCKGLNYLHNNNFVHKFITHKNLLVNGTVDNVSMVLADFDEFNSPNLENHQFEEPYKAPELQNINNCSVQSDLYLIGIVFLKVIANNDWRQVCHYKSYLVNIYHEETYISRVANLLTALTSTDPLERPDTAEVISRLEQIIDGDLCINEDFLVQSIAPVTEDFVGATVDTQVDVDFVGESVDTQVDGDFVGATLEAQVDVDFVDGTVQEQTNVDFGEETHRKHFRTKHWCSLCKKSFDGLPRHMRNFHRWSENSSSVIVNLTNQRKSQCKEDTRVTRICPVIGCKFISKRIDKHLKNKHKELAGQHSELLAVAMHFNPLTSLPDNSPEKLVCAVPRKKVKSTIVQKQANITPLTFVETKYPESCGILQLPCISHEEGSVDTKIASRPNRSVRIRARTTFEQIALCRLDLLCYNSSLEKALTIISTTVDQIAWWLGLRVC